MGLSLVLQVNSGMREGAWAYRMTNEKVERNAVGMPAIELAESPEPPERRFRFVMRCDNLWTLDGGPVLFGSPVREVPPP